MGKGLDKNKGKGLRAMIEGKSDLETGEGGVLAFHEAMKRPIRQDFKISLGVEGFKVFHRAMQEAAEKYIAGIDPVSGK